MGHWMTFVEFTLSCYTFVWNSFVQHCDKLLALINLITQGFHDKSYATVPRVSPNCLPLKPETLSMVILDILRGSSPVLLQLCVHPLLIYRRCNSYGIFVLHRSNPISNSVLHYLPHFAWPWLRESIAPSAVKYRRPRIRTISSETECGTVCFVSVVLFFIFSI